MAFSPEDWLSVEAGAWNDGVAQLGCFQPSDAPSIYECDLDPEHRRRFELPTDNVASLEHALAVIQSWERGRRAGHRCVVAVRAVSGEPVGGCEVLAKRDGVASLAYWTRPTYRGLGFSQRGVRLLCGWLDTLQRFATLEVLVAPDNVASLRVATGCGFERVGMREGNVLHARPSPLRART
jgi:[ribosomal protein S5]-alanine N-acetyltransferase